MKGVPRINLWLIAILCWIASYVIIAGRAGSLWSAVIAAILLILGLTVIRFVRSSVDPVAKGNGASAIRNIPLWLAGIGVIIFTSGWLSWLPQPVGSAVQSWHEWDMRLDRDEDGTGEANFDASTPSLPPRQAGQRSGLNWLWGESGPGPIPPRLDLSMSNNLAGFLSCNDEAEALWLADGRAYVSHSSYAFFDGRRWSGPGGERLRIPVDESGWSWIGSKPDPTSKSLAVDHTLTFETARGQALPVLQGFIGGRAPLSVMESGVVFSGQLSEREEFKYEALSQPRVWKDVRSRFEGIGSDVGESYLVKAGGELGRLIKDLVELEFSSEEGDLERLDQLLEWMQTEFDYSLKTSNLQELNPVQNFLGRERRGHCELFATATALLLREMGIPSRVCYGHAKGQFLGVSNLFAFRDRDAHAWAEVYLDAYGWVVFDTTPIGELGEPSEVSAASSVEELVSNYTSDEERGVTDPDAAQPTWLPRTSDGMLLGSGLALIVAALTFSIWLGRREGASGEVSGDRVPSYVDKIRRLARDCGVSNPASYPLRELVDMLNEKGLKHSALEEAVVYHYGATYESSDRRETYEHQLARRLGK